MKPFTYASAGSPEEVLHLLQRDGAAGEASRPLAGGTDLITLMKADVVAPGQLVDIKRAGLPRGIEGTAGGVVIGALTTLADIEAGAGLGDRHAALVEAAAVAATPQLRNVATIAGNLLQRPRCWYFRNRHLRCWLKGGDDCPAREGESQFHAIFGGGRCHAVHPSDLAPALIALDAQVRVRGPRGERAIPVAELFVLPADDQRRETRIAEDELIVSIHLPPLEAGTRSTFGKAMDRRVWAFALVGVAARLRLHGRRIAEARVVLSGVAPVPWRAHEAERALLEGEVGAPLFERAADAALAGASPLRLNGYKVPLARALVRRALETLANGAAAGPRERRPLEGA
jgi:xanthine dehydrogenase YagS FAD-binding subunit